MPELPDVEGFRREAEHVEHLRIQAVRVEDEQVVRMPEADRVPGLLSGRYVGVPRRRGKFLILPTSQSRGGAERPPTVLVHFGMTGRLRWCPTGTAADRHERVVFEFRGGELRYIDMRKLKGLYVAEDQSEVDSMLRGLGPDADSVTDRQYRSVLTRRPRAIKSALMDQSVLAGLGNLSVDEILWAARIHPKRSTTELADQDYRELHRTTLSVLRRSSRQGLIPDWPSWLTGHRNERNGRCPRCSTSLRRATVASRSTVWCPHCQPAPE